MNDAQALTALLGRWPAFYSWLIETKRIDAMHRVDQDVLDTTADFCPIHGGNSGSAWHFYEDADLEGGSVCNSCGSFANGILFLNRLTNAPDKVAEWITAYCDQECIAIPHEAVAKRVREWLMANDDEVAVAYLKNRGLPVTRHNLPPAIRGARKFPVYDKMNAKSERFVYKGEFAAMLSLVNQADGNPATYQFIGLTARFEKAKGELIEVKRTAGIKKAVRLSGAYVELGSARHHILVYCEGVETALAIFFAFKAIGLDIMVRATVGGGGNWAHAPVPEWVTTVFLCADADGFDNAMKTGAQLRREGCEILVAAPPATPANEKRDWLDVYVEESLDAVLDGLLERATPAEDEGIPRANFNRRAPDAPERWQELDINNLSDQDLFAALDASFQHYPPAWYIYNNEVVHTLGVATVTVNADTAAADVALRFGFYTETKQGRRAHPTPIARVKLWWNRMETRRTMLELLPKLNGILTRPTLVPHRKDDRFGVALLSRAGFNGRTGYFVQIDAEEKTLWKEAQPAGRSLRDLRLFAAMNLMVLKQELLCDFKFNEPVDEVNTLAALFTPLLTEVVPMVPFIVVDAPSKGSGKTTLVRAISAPFGGVMDVQYSHDDEELTKRLGTAFNEGKNLLLLDNLTGRIDSDKLKQLLTNPKRTPIRKLGSNNSIYPPAGLVVYASANNPEIQEEVLRRGHFIRLNTRMADPSVRRDFKKPNLMEWAEANETELRGYLYSILSAWLAAGAPRLACPTAFTGFQDWADLCFSLLQFAGHPHADLLLTNRALRLATGDPERDEMREFARAWLIEFGSELRPATDLLEVAKKNQMLPEITTQPEGKARKAMSAWLNNIKEQVFDLNGGNYEVVRDDTRTNAARVRFALILRGGGA